MINKVVLVGRITKDLELKYTTGGKAWTRFNLAVNRRVTNQQGEREADFPTIVVWGKQAENLVKYKGKGALIGIDGRVATGSYTDPTTQKKVYTTDVVAEQVQFLDSNGNSNQNNQPSNGGQSYQPVNGEDPFNTGRNPIEVSEDDLPF